MKTIFRFAVLTVAVIAAAAAVEAQEGSCTAHALMVRDALPASVGSTEAMTKLLTPAVDPQLSANFDPARVAGTVRDTFRPAARCGEFRQGDRLYDCRYDGTASALKIEMERGRVAYLNRDRSENKGTATITEADAVALARKAAEAAGMPLRELSLRSDVRTLRFTGAVDEAGTVRTEAKASEVHVRFTRRIGDVPVAFSRFHVAIDARGDIARMHVRWPDFRLAGGLKTANTASREAVTAKVLGVIDRENRCGSLSRITASVVYARTAVVNGVESSNDATEGEASTSDFVPALLVTAVPVEQKENSGVAQMPVQNYVVPLLRGAEGQ